ncbi:MAG TPA: phospholipid carrier-dependent glycosyltransferase [Ktedonobacteraceae bacterium]|jgi:4-amino-4-deoxy-L-arabinose transferase-like glycosyltransferase
MSGFSERASGSSQRVRWLSLLFWSAVLLLLLAAVVMRLFSLNAPFDRDSYDEGVYWQSLRAMQAGGVLYHTIFYAQPPAFLLTTFPVYRLFGGTLESARLAIALVSLLALPGVYLLGRALAGRAGALAALLLLVINPFVLAESQIIQAEASSVAFTFLATGCALQWWRQPAGWRGCCWAALAGAALVVSVLCKLLCISTLVPVLSLALARAWQVWHRRPEAGNWLPILAGCGGALLAGLALLLPFAGSFPDFWRSVVTFHQVAGAAVPGTVQGNLSRLEPALLSPLALLALYGTLAALLRKDWLVLPLLAWLLVTVGLLAIFHPLFPHHVIALEPPLLALAVCAVAGGESYKRVFFNPGPGPGADWLERVAPWIGRVATLLLLCTSLLGLWQDMQYYRATSSVAVSNAVLGSWSGLQFLAARGSSGAANPWQGDLRVADDLHNAITPGQWVVTDAQFIAGLADRDTPPALVDTSSIRIDTGYITLAQLEQIAALPRVHAILFYTNRLYREQPSFVTWVARHFHLLHTYGPARELWVR